MFSLNAFMTQTRQVFRVTAARTGGNKPVGRALLVLGLSAILAACGSNVKLDESAAAAQGKAAAAVPSGQAAAAAAPVQDRSVASGVETPQAPKPTAAPEARPVSGIEVRSAQAAQPGDMARVVYFDFDSTLVREEFRPVLEAHAQYLRADSRRQVGLEGHADERGSREYNLALGQRRSESVRRSLSLLGVADSQMEAVSFGEEKPAMAGQDEAAYAKNRRVEFTYR
ncbi:MAG: peptidoglycan-associated lipoprotein Pal [Pseudomonadota bacterium]